MSGRDDFGFKPIEQSSHAGELGMSLAVIESLVDSLEGRDPQMAQWRLARAKAFLARHGDDISSP